MHRRGIAEKSPAAPCSSNKSSRVLLFLPCDPGWCALNMYRKVQKDSQWRPSPFLLSLADGDRGESVFHTSSRACPFSLALEEKRLYATRKNCIVSNTCNDEIFTFEYLCFRRPSTSFTDGDGDTTHARAIFFASERHDPTYHTPLLSHKL